MGAGLVRSLQPPDILWIHWRVYNFIANTSKGVLFLPPSEAYVRSFLYLLYTLIKLYYTKALSDQALSLVTDWIFLLRGPRIPVSSHDATKTFHLGVSSWILQDKVRMLGALVLCSLSKHIFCCALLTLRCACVNEWYALGKASEESALLFWMRCLIITEGSLKKGRLVGGLYRPANAKDIQPSCEGSNQKWAKRVDRTLLSRSSFLVSLTIS